MNAKYFISCTDKVLHPVHYNNAKEEITNTGMSQDRKARYQDSTTTAIARPSKLPARFSKPVPCWPTSRGVPPPPLPLDSCPTAVLVLVLGTTVVAEAIATKPDTLTAPTVAPTLATELDASDERAVLETPSTPLLLPPTDTNARSVVAVAPPRQLLVARALVVLPPPRPSALTATLYALSA